MSQCSERDKNCASIRQYLLVLLFAWWPLHPSWAADHQLLPVTAPSGLSSDWLIHDATRNRLVLYLPDYHPPSRAYYQWLTIHPPHPFLISFAAREGQSFFLDNRLVFTAAATASYTLDLAHLLLH